ncbi:hypothetical protein [Tautonia plasticadhaerens]|uniref:Uncharacterized protein n=1 Tax=Tautonia plasticadhaerens TaxID=2527974 RepID=A0A518HAJ0_9BACT|nr:hypothetical protein [Tautonia plasticadhaerens]QDV37875.1 hypothetical protein ElP_58220 [Tautonia plasticadhaerens]
MSSPSLQVTRQTLYAAVSATALAWGIGAAGQEARRLVVPSAGPVPTASPPRRAPDGVTAGLMPMPTASSIPSRVPALLLPQLQLPLPDSRGRRVIRDPLDNMPILVPHDYDPMPMSPGRGAVEIPRMPLPGGPPGP